MNKNNVSKKRIVDIFKKRKPVTEAGFRFFSVLLPMVEIDDEPHLLYEVRSDKVRQQGEICFPGGELEEDEDSCSCALRETEEEIGISSKHINIVNKLGVVYTYSNFLMHCYLGTVSEEGFNDMKLNLEEVSEVFSVSVSKLLSREPEIYNHKIVRKGTEGFPYERAVGGRKYSWRTGEEAVPLYDIDGRVIWGLTGRITKIFVEGVNEGLLRKPTDPCKGGI